MKMCSNEESASASVPGLAVKRSSPRHLDKVEEAKVNITSVASPALAPVENPLTIHGNRELKRELEERVNKIGSGTKRQKVVAIDKEAAREAAHERAKKHFSCKSGSLLN
jgi:hypothetical protein